MAAHFVGIFGHSVVIFWTYSNRACLPRTRPIQWYFSFCILHTKIYSEWVCTTHRSKPIAARVCQDVQAVNYSFPCLVVILQRVQQPTPALLPMLSFSTSKIPFWCCFPSLLYLLLFPLKGIGQNIHTFPISYPCMNTLTF